MTFHLRIRFRSLLRRTMLFIWRWPPWRNLALRLTYPLGVRRHVQQELRRRQPLQPLAIYLEATNACNAECITCPREEMTRKKGFMSLELFERIAREARDLGVPELRLHNFGEVTLDRKLVDKVRVARRLGFERIVTYTNGELLTPELSRALIEAGLTCLYASIDGATKASFEYVRVGLHYERVRDHVMAFDRARREVTPRPLLFLTMIHVPRIEHEAQAFLDLWSPLADGVSVGPAHNWAEQKKLHSRLAGDPPVIPCPLAWNSIYVLWDGKVSICCEDFDGKELLGDLTRQSLAEVWHGEAFELFRRRHLDLAFDRLPICRDCHVPSQNPHLWTLTGRHRFV